MQHIHPNQIIGPYQVEGIIGAGGMGQILRVRRGPKIYAMKVLHATDPESLERFRREAEALVQTEQLPYFARVYNFGMNPLPYIVMEYVNAPDLKSWRKQQVISEDTALELTGKIATGLEAFHELGFVHRDLKPANILVRTDSSGELEPVIIDFGLVSSESFEELTRTGELMGTPLTMAPEQWQGGREGRDKASDIWALGIIHYFLVTGEYPFKGTPMQICNQVNRFDINDLLARVPESSQRTLLATLAVDPTERAKSALQVLPGDNTEFNRPRSMRLVIMACAVIILGLLLTVCIYYVYQERSRRMLQIAQHGKIHAMKGELEKSIKPSLAYFLAREHFKIEAGLNNKWRESLKEKVTDFASAVRETDGLSGRLQREYEQLGFTLSYCLFDRAEMPEFKWRSPFGERDEQILIDYLMLKSETCKYSQLRKHQLLRGLARSFVEKDYQFCFKEADSIDFPGELPKLKAAIKSEATLEWIYQILSQCRNVVAFPKPVYEFFCQSKSLQLRFQSMLQTKIKDVDGVGFESIVRTLINYRFGFDKPWPKLDPVRQTKLMARWLDKVNLNGSKLNSTRFELCCNVVYLESVYFSEFGTLPDNCNSLDQPFAVLFAAEGRVQEHLEAVRWMLNAAYYHALFSPVVTLGKMRSQFENLYPESATDSIKFDDSTDPGSIVGVLVNSTNYLIDESDMISDVYPNASSNENVSHAQVLNNLRKLIQLSRCSLTPGLKSFLCLAIAMNLNRLGAANSWSGAVELKQAMQLESETVRGMAKELLLRIDARYMITRICQLLELGHASSEANLEFAIEQNRAAMKLIQKLEQACREKQLTIKTKEGRVFMVRLTPSRFDFPILRKKAHISLIKILCSTNSKSAHEAAIKELMKYREMSASINNLVWWLGKLWHKTGDKSIVLKVLEHFGYKGVKMQSQPLGRIRKVRDALAVTR